MLAAALAMTVPAGATAVFGPEIEADGAVVEVLAADSDSSAWNKAPADTASPPPVVTGTPARASDRRRGPPEKKPFDEPRWVMMRSLVVPGWGQIYNRAWIKGLLVAGAEVGLALRIAEDYRALDDLQAGIDQARAEGDVNAELEYVNAYNARLEDVTGRQWWLGAVVAYALLDAYIDAHFRNFDTEFEYDPALPDRAPTARARLGYRWRF